MPVIIKPNLKIENIELEINKDDSDKGLSIMNTWGPLVPVIKINDYILTPGELRLFNLSIKLNSIPTFSMELIDTNYNIRRTLKKETLDKTVIFIGHKDWYIKFNGIILTVPSDAGDEILFITGTFFNTKLYESIQKQYNKLSILDVFTDICKLTDMGLFVYNNTALSKVIENNINPNNKQLDFFVDIITKYTNNIWCIDTFGFFHVSDIETLRKQPVDKYKIRETKINDVEKEITITTNIFDDSEDKFMAEFYTINTNIGYVHVNNNSTYNVKSAGLNKQTKEINSMTTNVGISNDTKNTFDRFLDSYFPYYTNIINKNISGKVINVTMRNIIYELSPFSIVNFEMFLPKEKGVNNYIDLENSGKKIVIGYEYSFEQDDSKMPKIKQSIDLI